MATLKRKRVSKKTKRSWRKHVDIKDVDAFLEDQRLEERLGWHADEPKELFHVDKTPSTTETVLSSKQKKRLALATKPLRCFAMLQPHTKVPDPITKRNRVRTKEERKNLLVKKKEDERRLNGHMREREIQSHIDRMINQLNKRIELNKDKFESDIWTTEVLDIDRTNTTDDWMSQSTTIHIQKTMKQLKKQTPKTLYKRPSVIDPVEIPHPGLSYNPSFDDHKALLDEIVKKEEGVIKKEQHLKRVTKDIFKKIKRKDDIWMSEMSEGLTLANKGQEKLPEDEPQDDTNAFEMNNAVINKKKTLKQKRKQREHNIQEALKRASKIEKRKVADIYKLRFIHKHVEKLESKEKLSQELHKKRQERKMKGTKRLGATKFEEPDVDFQLGTELPGNLRNLKNTTNLLADRYKSLQKRNIVPPGKMRVKKHGKVKKYVKSDHKDNWEITVAR